MLACFFKSIWNAWPTPKENSENNSVALIESRAKFLDITASLWLLTVIFFAHAHQQSAYQEILFEILTCLLFVLLRFCAAVSMDAAPNGVAIYQLNVRLRQKLAFVGWVFQEAGFVAMV